MGEIRFVSVPECSQLRQPVSWLVTVSDRQLMITSSPNSVFLVEFWKGASFKVKADTTRHPVGKIGTTCYKRRDDSVDRLETKVTLSWLIVYTYSNILICHFLNIFFFNKNGTEFIR